MSLTSNATAVRNAGQRSVSGESTTYRRGNEAIENLILVPANTSHDEYAETEVALSARYRDWICWASDLVKSGDRWEPQRNDAIDWTDPDGTLRTFQVLPREDGRCFRHTDQSMQEYRIYTVETFQNVEA